MSIITEFDTIRTETTAGVPNGSFEELTQTISIQDMNQGGKYSVWPVDYQNTCSFTIQEPTGWSSVNARPVTLPRQIKCHGL